MTINFKNAAEMNAFITNGIPSFSADEIDGLFDELTSEADAVDRIRSINAFSRVCLDY